MSDARILVINFLFRQEVAALQSAIDQLSFSEKKNLKTANEVIQELTPNTGALIIISLMDKNDILEIATLVKMLKKVSKEAQYRIVLMNFGKNPAFLKAVENLGLKEWLEPNFNTKAYKFKLDFHYKAIVSKFKKESTMGGDKSGKNENQKGDETKSNNKRPLVWSEPIDLKDDIWLVEESQVKLIFSRWLVKLLGPGTFVCQWVEEKSNLWRLDFKSGEKTPFVESEGAWFFQGEQKPEFDLHENVWFITGNQFELFFNLQDERFTRVKCDKNELRVCKNSSYAKQKEKLLIESLDKELTFKKEADRLENMEGESSTDVLDRGPMKGKVGEGSDEDKGPMKGKVGESSDKFNNLSGKGSTDKIENDNLSEKTETTKQSSFWKGKLGGDEEKEKGKEDENQEGSIENKSDQGDFQIALDPLKEGKLLGLKADNNFQKYYKNHNEAQTYGKADLPQKKGESEKAGGAPDSASHTSSAPGGEFTLVCTITSGTDKIRCRFYDFFEDQMIYLGKENALKPSAQVALEMYLSSKQGTRRLNQTGEVVSVEEGEKGQFFITVKISQEKVKEVETFMKYRQGQQKNISSFLQRSKGVA